MIPVLVANGYKVIAFDGPAHGQSEGDLSNLVHFKEAIGKLISIIGKPYAIIGHSMGAGSSTYFLMEENIRIERLVLLAVPIISKRFFDYVFDLMQIPQRLRKALYVSMEEKFQKPIEYYNLAARKEPIKADKILVVYDKQDEDVPYNEIDLFLAARPEVKSMLTDGIGHNRIMKDKGVIDAVVEFLK
jgi:pimeloyl-ACP methyl ester carboxylesterase